MLLNEGKTGIDPVAPSYTHDFFFYFLILLLIEPSSPPFLGAVFERLMGVRVNTKAPVEKKPWVFLSLFRACVLQKDYIGELERSIRPLPPVCVVVIYSRSFHSTVATVAALMGI